MLETLISLLLAHLLADFPLQTNTIYRLKSRAWWGVALHAAVHAAMALMLTRPPALYWHVYLIIGVVHFVIDWAKLRFKGAKQWPGFLLDQLAHIATALTVAWIWPDLGSALGGSLLWAAFFIAWIPAVLMFLWIYAGDQANGQRKPDQRVAWMRDHMLRYSQMVGYPLALIVIIGAVASLSA